MGSNSENEIVVLDGGFSWQLSRRKNKSIDGDVLWGARYLLTDPESVIETHLDFLRGMIFHQKNGNRISTNFLMTVYSWF